MIIATITFLYPLPKCFRIRLDSLEILGTCSLSPFSLNGSACYSAARSVLGNWNDMLGTRALYNFLSLRSNEILASTDSLTPHRQAADWSCLNGSNDLCTVKRSVLSSWPAVILIWTVTTQLTACLFKLSHEQYVHLKIQWRVWDTRFLCANNVKNIVFTFSLFAGWFLGW